MKLLLCAALVSVLVVGCSASAQPAPTATPDMPRYTAADTLSAIDSWISLTNPDWVRCSRLSDVHYEGHGVWTCVGYTFDEVSGRVGLDVAKLLTPTP